jgi:tetratricopeptide (TPR) repeat protein
VRPTPDEAGSFEQISFALLLIRVLDKRWSGTLIIEPPGASEHVVQLDRGLVSRVIVPDGYARLGDIVVEAGVIMEPELELALTRGSLLGQALAAARLIDAKTLQRALVLQLLKRLVRLFELPPETRWSYSHDTSAFAALPEGVRIDTLRVLWAGRNAHGETGNWIATTLRRIGESPFQVRGDVNLRRFGFTGDARNVVRIVRDEQCTLRDLTERAVAPEHIAQLIVYVLAITRHLDFAPAGTTAALSGLQIEDDPSTDSVSSSISESPPSYSESDSDRDSDRDPRDSVAGLGGAPTQPAQRVARIKLRRVAMRGESRESSRERAVDRGSSEGSEWEPEVRSDAPEAPTSASEREQLVRELQSRLGRLEQESSLSLLNLELTDFEGKSDDDVTDLVWNALEEASRRWHPDHCPSELGELREGMGRIHDAMMAAFEQLVDPARRQTALERARTSSAAHRSSSDPPSGRRTVDGPPPKLHERALMAFAEQRYQEALRLCRQASEASPHEPDYHATLAWIRAHLPDAEIESLLLDLDALLSDYPTHVAARYYRAVLRQRARRRGEARDDLERVLALDPAHEGARHQLELLIASASSGTR